MVVEALVVFGIVCAIPVILYYTIRGCLVLHNWNESPDDRDTPGERSRRCRRCGLYQEYGIYDGAWVTMSPREMNERAERRREEQWLWPEPPPPQGAAVARVAKPVLWETRKRDRLIGEET